MKRPKVPTEENGDEALNEIVLKETLSPEIKLYKVKSPLIAKKRKAGQFVVVRLDERGERIPLTIADSDPQEGTITLVVQEVGVTTDDGSYGRHGFVTDELARLFEDGVQVDLVVAVGPAIMMKAVCDLTKSYNIRTIVSLNSIMVDATGMCGACRVEVGGETKFACVDGPEFDGHRVDFDLLMARLRMYLPEEKRAMEAFKKKARD